ncbi:MAG: site-specific DNA-methyltransferase, partial [Atribacterota bacterium]|nr:site-specific DNA-methyltransferase [Atribacterota bacterium]
VDAEGRKFSTNTDTEGRFHSKWLNMMYPRLFLAKNLLCNSGFIFISADDNEVTNLRKICDEIFGEENFIDCIIWKKRYGGGSKEKHLVSIHEYILFYSKNIETVGELFVPYNKELINKYYKFKDENYPIRGPYRTHPLEAGKAVGERKNLVYPIKAPDGSKIMPLRQWYWSKDRVKNAIKNNELEFAKVNNTWKVYTKQYLKDIDGKTRRAKAFSIIEDVYTQHGTNEIINIFGNIQIFPYPKPIKLIQYLLKIATNLKSDDIILDFFAGSATTAHAVLDLNKEDGGNRKFIMVQLPENCDEKSEAYKAGFKTIADIGKERICRVIAKIKQENSQSLFKNQLDLGFKSFKLDSSNFKIWNTEGISTEQKVLEKQLELHINHINPDSSQEDILFEILLKAGYQLSDKVKKIELAGKNVYSVNEGAMLICLEKELTKEVIKAMAERKPGRVICLDQGFTNNDQLKTNAVQIMKSKGIDDFRTV